MYINTISVGREQIKLGAGEADELKDADLDKIRDFLAKWSSYRLGEMETIVSIFEDDGTFIRSFEF